MLLTLLPGDNLQRLICECHMRGEDTGSMAAAVLTLAGTVWAQARHLSSERRTEWFNPGSQIETRKAHHLIHDTDSGQAVPAIQGPHMIYRKGGLRNNGGKEHQRDDVHGLPGH